MRVLHIGKFYPPSTGGIENFMGDLLPALYSQGVEVAALVHDDPQFPVEDHQEEVIPKVQRVPCYGRLLYAPISPGFPWALKKMILDFRPDILHFHLPNTSAFWAMLLPVAKKLPWVIHWHADVVASKIDKRMAIAYLAYRPFEQRMLARSCDIIATSENYLATSASLSAWRRKCTVIPLGINPDRLSMPTEQHLAEANLTWGEHNRTKILAIGRLTYYKGHEVLVRAVAEEKNLQVIIVGQGSGRKALEDCIKRLKVEDRVTLTGFLPNDRLNAFMATCDCLCLPSLERTEAFGLVLLEAMRYSKPVVASKITGSGIGWVVKDGISGFLAEPGDYRQMAAALHRLSMPGKSIRQMGRAGEARLQTFFHIERVARKIRALYQDVLKQRTSQ